MGGGLGLEREDHVFRFVKIDKIEIEVDGGNCGGNRVEIRLDGESVRVI